MIRFQLEAWIMPQASVPFSGIVEALKELSEKYKLYAASNQQSFELEFYFKGMGILDCFEDQLFGLDLIDAMKHTLEFYHKIFEMTGVTPEQAIVLNDSPKVIKIIKETGVIPIQSCLPNEHLPVTKYHFSKSDELMSLIEEIVEQE